MTEGQRAAIQQLREIEVASGGAIEVVWITEPEAGTEEKMGQYVTVDVSYRCKDMPRAEGGLPLHDRERLILRIPPDFPFDRPSVRTRHGRFATFPHVQWGCFLCLYLAPDTEWNASDGMFGFLTRLDEWLKHGALNELDPQGAPLHPPAVYPTADKIVIPRVNTPEVHGENWFGLAHLNVVSDTRVDIVGWSSLLAKDAPPSVAATVLLASPLTFFEFPTEVKNLLVVLNDHQVSRQHLLLTFQAAVLRNEEKAPLYVVIGSPMRGIQGEDDRKQNLTVWYVDPVLVQALHITLEQYSSHERLREIGAKAERIIWDWAAEAPTMWCSVHEDRPEVTRRRDRDAAVASFRGSSVTIWGCGALGSHIAEHLVRAGVHRLILYDNKIVTPGILTRQLFDDADIGGSKAQALADRLRRIQPDTTKLEIEAHARNILRDPLAAEDWTDGADVVIDATASAAVAKKLERRWGRSPRRVPVVSMVVGHRAERGFVVLPRSEHSGGTVDVTRRTKLALLKATDQSPYFNEFWPTIEQRRERMFQPEPGCSDRTFVGSSTDLATLAGMMLNSVASDLSIDGSASAFAHLVAQPHVHDEHTDITTETFSWSADITTVDRYSGYEVRLSPSSWSGMQKWIKRSRWLRGSHVETGGLLFGELDEAAKVIWVSDVSGPPLDSEASRAGFVCGSAGTAEKSERKREESQDSIRYLGMWHTHPGNRPEPSIIDHSGAVRLLRDQRHALVVIVGGRLLSDPITHAFVFTRQDLLTTDIEMATPRIGFFASIRRSTYLLLAPITERTFRGRGSWYHKLARLMRRIRN